MNKQELIKHFSKKVRIKIYDSVWIDEEEDVYMEKTGDVVDTCLCELLDTLVDDDKLNW